MWTINVQPSHVPTKPTVSFPARGRRPVSSPSCSSPPAFLCCWALWSRSVCWWETDSGSEPTPFSRGRRSQGSRASWSSSWACGTVTPASWVKKQSEGEIRTRVCVGELTWLGSSFPGKTGLPVLQLVRVVVVGAAVQPVWDNELRGFVCNTQQPGCSHVAFNHIFPFSLHQYWTLQVQNNSNQLSKYSLNNRWQTLLCLQVVLVLAPGLIFFCYLVHVVIQGKKVQRKDSDRLKQKGLTPVKEAATNVGVKDFVLLNLCHCSSLSAAKELRLKVRSSGLMWFSCQLVFCWRWVWTQQDVAHDTSGAGLDIINTFSYVVCCVLFTCFSLSPGGICSVSGFNLWLLLVYLVQHWHESMSGPCRVLHVPGYGEVAVRGHHVHCDVSVRPPDSDRDGAFTERWQFCTYASCFYIKVEATRFIRRDSYALKGFEQLLNFSVSVPQCVVLNRERLGKKQQNNKIAETSGFQMDVKEEGATSESNESCSKLNI